MYNFNHVYFAPLFIKIDDKPKNSFAARDPSPARPTEASDPMNIVARSEQKAADDIDWKNDEGYRGKEQSRSPQIASDPEDKQVHPSDVDLKPDQSDSDFEVRK